MIRTVFQRLSRQFGRLALLRRVMSDKPIILSIAGVEPSGGAGIVADVKTIAALECFPAVAITFATRSSAGFGMTGIHIAVLSLTLFSIGVSIG